MLRNASPNVSQSVSQDGGNVKHKLRKMRFCADKDMRSQRQIGLRQVTGRTGGQMSADKSVQSRLQTSQ